MLLFQKFSVMPKGYVQGGSLQYSADTDTGVITYSYNITAKMFFFSKNFTGSGTTKTDPKQFLSSNIKVGENLVIGPITIKVNSIAKEKATCKLTVENEQIHEAGELVLDLSKQHISILSVNEAGTVAGFEINLTVLPV